MRRCRTCLYPDTKPDLFFDETGECSACVNAKKKREIDWEARKAELIRLLDHHNGECIVPSSGGKDSSYIALKMQELGAHVTCVTATTCHLTDIGRKNIDNLARYAKTIEVSPNKTVRAKLNRIGLEMVGDISWPEHVSIFTTPFRMAVDLGIPLIMYGESPQLEYGGPQGTEQAKEMTRRWVSEFGGFLGLRPQDMVYMTSEQSMRDYMPPTASDLERVGVQAHFLGQYIPWDSDHNAEVAMAHGMKAELPCMANWWKAENQDNAQTGLHDYMMWRKYGFGRACSQVSVDIRKGKLTRADGLKIVEERDGWFPDWYARVHVEEMLERIGLDLPRLKEIMDKYTNKEIHAGT